MKKKIFTILSLIFLVSCHILPQNDKFYTNRTTIELGIIGKKEQSIRKTAFQTFGIPYYQKKIKLKSTITPFTKHLFKHYKKMFPKSKTTFNDTLPTIPNFIEIEIIDKVSVIKAINTDNPFIFNYLKKSPRATLVTSIRLVANNTLQNKIQQADALYMKTDKHKKQWIYLYRNSKEISTINLSETAIFEYKLSSFCWEITPRKEIILATILNESQNCSANTQRNSQKLEEKLTNSFKF
ncbi:conserved exported hypothetical protein [Tenacibaculum maritimum]|uniref:hypothetical protein n=1 Tax=Tenacibaculum maritimum TaxID=107401 RepID=UPI0012E6552A|nr:hypothetical protein [Tenacibaculum maritimum]CAA0163892.1 conserved exported hypothetical protein [Tenacibaculum maritimum]CAA0172634.1 conserved exported hypothetical protein [Tenacibaculum maritimum]